MTNMLKAPFPWFGGKSRVAHLVWDRFGDTRNYVEPFFGSGAVLLRRPTEAKIETINDLDCWVANFWRAVHSDPEKVAHFADWPVNEADLQARHLWLVNQTDFRERMKSDPDFFDCKIAGWWVWGISQWIGSGWCSIKGSPTQKAHGGADGSPVHGRPFLNGSQGVHVWGGRGAAGKSKPRGVHCKRPMVAGDNWGKGVFKPSANMPSISGDSGCSARGVIANEAHGGIYEWFASLADRLRRVRVCCGDWQRILGPASTSCIGVTAVFLDPPYAVEDRSDVYGEESRDVAHDVREWAIAHGSDSGMRIALCGYDGEHAMPANWQEVAWKTQGGFGNQRPKTRGRENAGRERIWFSPHCLNPQGNLFSQEMSLETR